MQNEFNGEWKDGSFWNHLTGNGILEFIIPLNVVRACFPLQGQVVGSGNLLADDMGELDSHKGIGLDRIGNKAQKVAEDGSKRDEQPGKHCIC